MPALQQLCEPLYLIDVNPTAENIAKIIFDVARQHGFPVVETRLWETPHCYATYRENGLRRCVTAVRAFEGTDAHRPACCCAQKKNSPGDPVAGQRRTASPLVFRLAMPARTEVSPSM